MTAILVTGGAGYIGSHCCKVLSNVGYTPVTYDSLERGHASAVQWGPLEQGNILDVDRLTEVIQQYRPQAVMHFAAYALVGESVEYPDMYYRNNVEGSRKLIDTMLQNGINKMIFSSTCATYGTPQEIPIPEEHQQKPINPYGVSKLQIEKLLCDYDQTHNFKSVSLRYFNAAGADPDTQIGEDHDPETHLIPIALDTALGIHPYLTINGDNYETADGTCIRDYIHIMDVAQAHLKALEQLLNNNCNTSFYNLGNSCGFSVREIIAKVEQITGKKLNIKIGPRRAGDPPVLIGKSDKVRQELGWQPEFSSIDQIIETAWRWHRKKHTDSKTV